MANVYNESFFQLYSIALLPINSEFDYFVSANYLINAMRDNFPQQVSGYFSRNPTHPATLKMNGYDQDADWMNVHA